MKYLYLSLLLTGMCMGLGLFTAIYAYQEYAKRQDIKPHKPVFTTNQCFVKGLREPWDADVAGMVIHKGYQKYLVMYASEADRNSLGAKQGWEEDIRSFDSKYIPAPCPETWITKKRTK